MVTARTRRRRPARLGRRTPPSSSTRAAPGPRCARRCAGPAACRRWRRRARARLRRRRPHSLVLDGVFGEAPDGTLAFHAAKPPSDEEVARLLATIYRRVRRLLARRGLDVD